MLLHGFTNTGACWRPVLDAGAAERYRPIAPDLRGHGSAGDLVPVTLDAVVGDIATLAPGRRFTLAGYSMGGRIALHVALAMPERIDRLVLIGASAGLADPAERAARRRADEQLAAEFESSTIDELASRWAQTPVLAGLPPSTAALANADRLRNTPGGLARALRGLGTGALPSLWDRLSSLAMPVTLLAGERDPKFVMIAERMQALIADRQRHGSPGRRPRGAS